MNPAVTWIGAGLLLVSCTDPVAEAERKLAFVRNNGTLAEICEASKEVKAAYLAKRDELGHLSASINERSACMDADILRRDGYDPRHPEIRVDDMDPPNAR